MSDVSQGPGWWIASDGQWYPPELHPDARATADVAASPASFEQTTTGPAWSESGPRESSLLDGNQVNGSGVVPHWGSLPGAALETPPVVSNGLTGGAGLLARPVTDDLRRTRHGRTPLLAMVAVVVLVAGGVLVYSLTQGPGQSLAGDSAQQVVAMATAAAEKAGSVHVVVHIAGQGQTATYVEDAATDAGRQVITGTGGVEVTTLVVGGTAYVKASRAAMTDLYQASDTVARKYAGRWLSFPSSVGAYKQITDAVTLATVLKEVTPTASGATLTHSVMDGQSVVGVGGQLPGRLPGTLYVAATGSPLPIEEMTRSSGTVTTALFSDWGESVTITPPTGAIAASTIPSFSGGSGGTSSSPTGSTTTGSSTGRSTTGSSDTGTSPSKSSNTGGTGVAGGRGAARPTT